MFKSLLPILLFFLLVNSVSPVAAFQSDTTAYQLQRLKVNALLTQRSQKFGQYDQSLDQRTGIFGFQTKQDIKNSNEILRQIVLNDNNIFKELKILMDYKDQEVAAVQRSAIDASNRIQSYKTAIKKLQDQNEVLKNEAQNSKSGNVLVISLIFLLAAALVGTIYFFRRKLKQAGQ